MSRKFKPAKGVNIDNCMRHIAAIEEAVRRDLHNVVPENRDFVLRCIYWALCSAGRTVLRLRKDECVERPLDPEEEATLAAIRLGDIDKGVTS